MKHIFMVNTVMGRLIEIYSILLKLIARIIISSIITGKCKPLRIFHLFRPRCFYNIYIQYLIFRLELNENI